MVDHFARSHFNKLTNYVVNKLQISDKAQLLNNDIAWQVSESIGRRRHVHIFPTQIAALHCHLAIFRSKLG